jgi:hypothetical protein
VTVINWPPQLLPPLPPPSAASAVVPFVRPPVLPPPAAPAVVAAGLPLLKAAAVLALAVGAGVLLAQIWGRLNSNRGNQQTTGPDPRPPGLPETAYGGTLYQAPPGQRLRVVGPPGSPFGMVFDTAVSFWWVPVGTSDQAELFVSTPDDTFGWFSVIFDQPDVKSGTPPASFVKTYIDSAGSPTTANPVEPFVPQPRWEPEPTTRPDFPEPEPQTEPLPEPERPRPIVPVIAPPVPGSVPIAPPGQAPSTPGSEPQAPPAVAPRTPAYPQPTPTQQPTPTGQPTAPDGSLVPLPLPLPRLTPTNSHVINGTEVPANGPAPTLTGIAQELGRLERKSAQLLDPGRAPTGPNLDRLGLLDELIRPLVEAILQQFQSGAYELSSPCELNEAGERVPVVVPFGPGLSAIGTLHNKIDALAELLQASKDLKQPICRPKAPIGEPVTVNFEQVT